MRKIIFVRSINECDEIDEDNCDFEPSPILVHIYDIEWDTDSKVDLPKEIDASFTYEDEEDLVEEISDWLSDNYEYCVLGFRYYKKY